MADEKPDPTDATPEMYAEAEAADEAWMVEIRAAFQKQRAGDVRYTRAARGEEGSPLRAAYDRFDAACKAIWG